MCCHHSDFVLLFTSGGFLACSLCSPSSWSGCSTFSLKAKRSFYNSPCWLGVHPPLSHLLLVLRLGSSAIVTGWSSYGFFNPRWGILTTSPCRLTVGVVLRLIFYSRQGLSMVFSAEGWVSFCFLSVACHGLVTPLSTWWGIGSLTHLPLGWGGLIVLLLSLSWFPASYLPWLVPLASLGGRRLSTFMVFPLVGGFFSRLLAQ